MVTGRPRRLRWTARDYAAAARWQAGTVARHDRPDAWEHPAEPVGPPVVLLPGVYEPWRFLRPVAAFLHGHGVRVHVVPGLGLHTRPVEDGARTVAAYLARRDLRGVVLVAHSKGGLVGKHLMLHRDPDGRVARLVAVNTPFDGSSLARWTPSRTLRALRPTDPVIRALAAELAVNERIVHVQSRWDPHVPGGASLPGARAVELATPGHFRPLADPELQAVLLDVLGLDGPAA